MYDPLQTLVAVVLSAQCLDSRVNEVTPTLFARCKTPQDYVDISQDDLEKLIGSITYFKTKASNIKKTCAIMIEKHNGQVPSTFEELTALPGVGTKTANVVLGVMGITSGFVVDTHVKRVSTRLGFTAHKTVDAIRKDLERLFPKELWDDTANRLILHGRYVCKARDPQCGTCKLNDLCPSAITKQ